MHVRLIQDHRNIANKSNTHREI